MVEHRRIRLDESLVYLSGANSLDFFDDGSFVIASADVAAVVLYDGDGHQRRVLGSWGPGPLEYERPRIVRVAGRSVFVYDAGQGKYLAIDSSGRVMEEWKGTVRSPDDFVVRGSWIIGLMAHSEEFLIEGFDTASTDTMSAAPSNLETAARNAVDRATRFGADDERLYFAYPGRNELQVLDIAGGETSTVPLPSEGFKLEEFPFTNPADINVAMFDGRLLQHVYQNSRVDGADVLDDYVVVHRIDGELPLQGVLTIPSSRRRSRRLVVYNRSLRHVDTVVLDFETLRVLGRSEVGSDGNALYYVLEATPDGGRTVEWHMLEFRLEPNM